MSQPKDYVDPGDRLAPRDPAWLRLIERSAWAVIITTGVWLLAIGLYVALSALLGPPELPMSCNCAGKPEGCYTTTYQAGPYENHQGWCALWPGNQACCIVVTRNP